MTLAVALERFMNEEVKQRKIEHVSVALGQDVSVAQRANWNDIQFVHQALPEVDLDEIDTSVTFLGRKLRYPIFISSLTGGHPDVTFINANLARAGFGGRDLLVGQVLGGTELVESDGVHSGSPSTGLPWSDRSGP